MCYNWSVGIGQESLDLSVVRKLLDQRSKARNSSRSFERYCVRIAIISCVVYVILI